MRDLCGSLVNPVVILCSGLSLLALLLGDGLCSLLLLFLSGGSLALLALGLGRLLTLLLCGRLLGLLFSFFTFTFALNISCDYGALGVTLVH